MNIQNTQEYIASLLDTKGQCDLGRFTIIQDFIGSELELAALVSATGVKNVVDIVIFTPKKTALYHTAAVIQTEIAVKGEYYLKPLVLSIFNSSVLPQIKKFVARITGTIKIHQSI